MFKGIIRDIALMLQARSGITAAMFIWIAVALFAALTAFAFLCVAAYDWLALQFEAHFAALIMAGGLILIALIGVTAANVSRRRAQARAIAERAARAQAASSTLLDPKVLGLALQAGRAVGWQRLAPIALLGVIAGQWFLTRHRVHHSEEDA